MKATALTAAIVALACLAHAAHAADAGIEFDDGEWQLVCDNTRTCRAAGYQQGDYGVPAVSVLLTRAAGPGQSITGQLQLGDALDEELPDAFAVTMEIDGVPYGTIDIPYRIADLASAQVDALLAALQRDSAIAFTHAARRWQLSASGAVAVLGRMDAAQGRVGTIGALVQRGARDEADVLPALPVPVVVAARVAETSPADGLLAGDPSLRHAIEAATPAETCTAFEAEDEDAALTVHRLDAHTLLVSRLCWRGAYNEGHGYWVTDAIAPYAATLVTPSGTEYADGRIEAAHRSRAIGDCRNVKTWVWDGAAFVPTAASSTGLCKRIAIGGAWELPTFISSVRAGMEDGS